MAETPYCPLLSIGKELPVLCQEDLCMWYIKQLKLCSITVQAYTDAINLEVKPSSTPSETKKKVVKPSLKPDTEDETPAPKPINKPTKSNPFALDDLE